MPPTAAKPRRCAPRPVRMDRAGKPVTVHAHRARDRCRYCRRVLPDPQGHRARQETWHARCVPGSPAPTWSVTSPRSFPRYYPRVVMAAAKSPPYPAAAPPTPPSGTAIRSAHRSSPGIQRTSRSPVAVLVYLSPAASVRTTQRFKAMLSSVAVPPPPEATADKERCSRPHTRRPLQAPGLRTLAAKRCR